MPRGRFVVFEGGEGSGKSTQSKLLAERLGAVLTREPGGTPSGERIRCLLLDRSTGPLSARCELLLMLAARAQHVDELIRPALDSGQDVVCDRFSGSTIAYQGHGRGLPLDEVEAACALAAGGLRPDLTILLALPPATAASRRCGSPDRIESEGEEFHARVLDGFTQIAADDPSGWVVVDGTGTIAEIGDRVGDVVSARLGPLFGRL